MISNILKEDIKRFVISFESYEQFRNSSFLITGSTGLIGYTLVLYIEALNRKHDLNIRITCPVRNMEKVFKKFNQGMNEVEFVKQDLISFIRDTEKNFDYIIHCAAPTTSKYFVEYPVEAYEMILQDTLEILKYCKQNNVDGFVYVSSLECYGSIMDENKPITEDMQGYINPLDVRSSYSMGKRAAETLCYAYFKEYGINVKIARLTQIVGPGVSIDDNRVFAQFTRRVLENSDIILHTLGESSKPYCYTGDCILALLLILLNGESGEAYNVSNDETYISIRELAEFLRCKFNPNIRIITEHKKNLGYAPVTKLPLNSDKLRNLGWKPKYGLYEMFYRYMESIK